MVGKYFLIIVNVVLSPLVKSQSSIFVYFEYFFKNGLAKVKASRMSGNEGLSIIIVIGLC